MQYSVRSDSYDLTIFSISSFPVVNTRVERFQYSETFVRRSMDIRDWRSTRSLKRGSVCEVVFDS